MRYWLIAALAVVVPGFSMKALGQEAPPAIVFVNLDSVFTNYNKTKVAEAQLMEQSKEIKAELDDLVSQVEKVQAQYDSLLNQSQGTALSEEARSAKKAEAGDKLIEVRDMQNKVRRMEESARRKMDEQRRRSQKRLVDEMNVLIREHAVAKGYAAIIDSSGSTLNGLPAVVFYNPKYDITDEIIAVVNKKAK